MEDAFHHKLNVNNIMEHILLALIIMNLTENVPKQKIFADH